MRTFNQTGEGQLWSWFSLSYASFAVIPRVLMHEMPDEWQGRMAKLLREFDEHWINLDLQTRVQKVERGKMVKWPEWMLNYRHPHYEEIDQLKAVQSVHAQPSR